MEKSNRVKLVVFVPKTHADKVRKAMGRAGAGRLGNYAHCTFSLEGVGRFKPEDGANPTQGKIGQLESVLEERIETVCERSLVNKVVSAIKKVHPYDEIPLDIYPIEEI